VDAESPATHDAGVEEQVAAWLGFVRRGRALTAADADELEDHLRSRMADLGRAGLHPDEAFLVALKRMGRLDELTREFAREHSDRLWKQLVLTDAAGHPAEHGRRGLVPVVAWAVAAAVLVKLPAAFGLSLDHDTEVYARNLGLFALAPLAGFFGWRRAVPRPVLAALVALFALGAVAANVFALADDWQTQLLTAIHLPIALWLTVGVAYTGGEWRDDRRRMDFIRFTGEWFIYYVLIALGGGVLTGLVLATFRAIGVDAEPFVTSWLLPCGAMGAVVVAGWLVDAKQSVIENMAPVLTRVFSPLFLAALTAFVVGVVVTGHGVDIDRDVLITFDLLLVVVLGLLLYGISAREPSPTAGWFDLLQAALVAAALLIDVLVLAAVVGRISDFGFSANKAAALGENIILLVNLAWSAVLLAWFLRGHRPFALLDRWQTRCLGVYAAWAWIVVLGFPVAFDLL
jgi:hypothetical protein